MVTEEIGIGTKERNIYGQRGDHPNWRKKRNFITRLVEKTKRSYFKNLINMNKSNINGLWTIIKEMIRKDCLIYPII